MELEELVAGQRCVRDAAQGVATPEGGFERVARRVNNSCELYRASVYSATTYSVFKRYVFLFFFFPSILSLPYHPVCVHVALEMIELSPVNRYLLARYGSGDRTEKDG